MNRTMQGILFAALLVLPGAALADDYRFADAEAQPAWAVRYGEEFWRRTPAGVEPRAADAAVELPATAGFDVGDVIDRVTHALVPGARGEPPEVRAPAYAASITAGGLELEPLAPASSAGVGARLSVRATSISRGGSMLWTAAGSAAEWSVLGNVAQRELDPAGLVVEHYETGRAGVEVTWLLGGPPRGRGAIVVEVAVSGAQSVEESSSGVLFTVAEDQPRVVMGRAVAVDAAGARWAVPATWTGTSVVFEVPEEVLAAAVYPLAVDPTVGPELNVLQPAPGSQWVPRVASNGTDFLVCWNDWSVGQELVGTRVTAGGTVLDPAGIPVSGNGRDAALASISGDYLAIWNVTTAGADHVEGALVRSSDGLVTSLGWVSPPVGQDTGFPAVAGSGGRYLVAWLNHIVVGANEHVWVAPIDSNGVVQPAQPIDQVAEDKGPLSVAARGAPGNETFLVAWTDNTNAQVEASRVDRNGGGSPAVPIDSGIAVSDKVAVGSDGNDYLATWGRSGPVRARLVPLAPAPPLGAIQTVTNSGGDPAVTWQGTSYFVVHEGAGFDTYGRRLDSTGVPIDPISFVVSSHPTAFQSDPKVASNGAHALVVWSDDRNGAGDVHAVRVTTGGAIVPPETLLSTDTAYSQQNPSIAANGTFYMVVWEDYRHTRAETFAARVRISDGSLKDPFGIQIPVPADTAVSTYNFKQPDVASNGTDFLVTWGNQRLDTPPPPKLPSTYSKIEATLIRGADVSVPIILPTVIVSTGPFNTVPAVAWRGTHFFVAWESNRALGATPWDIYGNWVKEAAGGGSLSVGPEFAVSTAPGDQRWADVAGLPGSQNYSYLVTWYDGRNYSVSGYDIWASRVREDAGAWAVCLSRAVTNNTANDQWYAAAATNGTNTFVVWQDKRNDAASGTDIWGSKLTQFNSGVCAASSQFNLYANIPITQALNNQVFPAIASDGTGYLVGWPDYGSNGDLFVSQVDSAGGVVNPNGIGVAAGPLMAPALAGGATDTYLSGYWRMPGSVPRVMLRTLTSPWP